MYDDGLSNDFEVAHQRGLARGFDLGWSYKGRFDQQIILDHITMLEERLTTVEGLSNTEPWSIAAAQVRILKDILSELKEHSNNREFIT